MCRYGTNIYKPHYACFDCRKTFKRRLLTDIDKDAIYNKTVENNLSKCPECGNPMANMGLDFESPKKNDVKAWIHMKNLYESGITYHSCGCSGPGYIPKDKKKLIEFLNERKQEYIKHQRFWHSKTEAQNGDGKNQKTDKAKAVKHWAKKIQDLENRLEKLK